MDLHKIMRKMLYDIEVTRKLKGVRRNQMYVVMSKKMKTEYEIERKVLLKNEIQEDECTAYGIPVLVDTRLEDDKYKIMYNEMRT